MDDLTPILQRIPQFANAKNPEIKELTGGITNKNYKITVDGEAFVLRLGGNETTLLGIDRQVEYECSRLAAQIGVAPEPIAFLAPEGYIVARFISGKPMPAEEIGSQENIARVVASMKLYHSINKFPGFFSPFRVAEEYAKTAHSYKVKLPHNIDWILDRSAEIEKAMYANETLTLRPCHNDLLNGNFIDDGTRVRILDWEYAGMGDIFFDLGNFSHHHRLNEEEVERFLFEYFGEVTDKHYARLRLMWPMSELHEAMWGTTQTVISSLEEDFHGYANLWFGRFRQHVTDFRWEQWLKDAGKKSK
jgi:thiamine kinase-like enzyme